MFSYNDFRNLRKLFSASRFKPCLAHHLGGWRTWLAHWTENPRTLVRFQPLPPRGSLKAHGAVDELDRVTSLSRWSVRVRSPPASPKYCQTTKLAVIRRYSSAAEHQSCKLGVEISKFSTGSINKKINHKGRYYFETDQQRRNGFTPEERCCSQF